MSEKQLIFLMSQPRSGSTLLQKILGANEEIYTRSEPWLMLAPAYAFKGSGIYAEYNKRLEGMAVDDFISELPGGSDFYTQKISEAYAALYSSYLEASGKSYFLDKTPRYSLIIDQLSEMYPAAKQIILIRDPLSVLNSLIPRKHSVYQLSDNNIDLTKALDNLLTIVNDPAKNQYVVRYEELVQHPEQVVSDLCEFIGISYSNEMLSDYIKGEHWKYGDQKIYASKGIEAGKCDTWKKSLDDPQYWRVFNDYLDILGPEKYKGLGYDYELTKKYLIDHCPYDDQLDMYDKTIALSVLLDNSRDCYFALDVNKKKIQELTEISNRKDRLIEEKQKLITQKNEELARRQDVISEKNKRLEDKKDSLQAMDAKLKKIDSSIEAICRSSLVGHPIKKIKAYKNMLKTYREIKE